MGRMLLMCLLILSAASIRAASVTSYGATANDGTDDTAAIADCLNYNTDVSFPSGTFIISAKLMLEPGRTFYGPSSGAPAILRVTHDTGNADTNRAIQVAGNNVTIRDIVIDKDFVDGSYGIGIYANGYDNLTIEGVEIKDYSVRYGIHLIECDNFEIDSCYVHSFMMDQVNPSGYESDMIQDSPAGIRVTRCVTGSITNCIVNDIEVGANGRASISELVPSYGAQTYQADCITVSDCSGITVTGNDLWNSGELLDLLVSDNCTVSTNTMQMAWYLDVKCIGSQDSDITDNYLGDAAVGIYLGDHSTGEQCTGNLIDQNEIVNCGSRGIWDIAAYTRLPWTTSGIFVENNASGNTMTANNIYNYYSYLTEGIRQGTGSNTYNNNNAITTLYGPAGGPNAALLGSWVSGLTHTKENYGMNRLLVFFTFAKEEGADLDCTAVTYGGKSMTLMNERLVTEGSRRVYVSAWMLKQDSINMASSSGTFSPTWNRTPDYVGYSSTFVENVKLSAPVYSEDTGAATSGSTISCSPRATQNGDLVVYGAVAAFTGSFTPNNSFTEGIEVTMSDADGSCGSKAATGSNETASANHTNMGTAGIYMGVLDRN